MPSSYEVTFLSEIHLDIKDTMAGYLLETLKLMHLTITNLLRGIAQATFTFNILLLVDSSLPMIGTGLLINLECFSDGVRKLEAKLVISPPVSRIALRNDSILMMYYLRDPPLVSWLLDKPISDSIFFHFDGIRSLEVLERYPIE